MTRHVGRGSIHYAVEKGRERYRYDLARARAGNPAVPAAKSKPRKPRAKSAKSAKSRKLKRQAAGVAQHVGFADIAPTASPSKKGETEAAIKLAARELRKDPELKRAELYELLFGPKHKRASSARSRDWVTAWTLSRFLHKVWKPARERAELNPLSPKGRRFEK